MKRKDYVNVASGLAADKLLESLPDNGFPTRIHLPHIELFARRCTIRGKVSGGIVVQAATKRCGGGMWEFTRRVPVGGNVRNAAMRCFEEARKKRDLVRRQEKCYQFCDSPASELSEEKLNALIEEARKLGHTDVYDEMTPDDCAYWESVFVDTPPVDESHKIEGTLAEFDRYIAGDR